MPICPCRRPSPVAHQRNEREEVALAVAQANGCGYCLSAHSALAKGAGVAAETQFAARQRRELSADGFARK